MLEFGFDESDFSEVVRKKEAPKSYNAKHCKTEWYLDGDAPHKEHEDPATVYKFRADHHYYHGNIGDAVKCLNKTLENLGSKNKTMRRETMESLIRCHMRNRDFMMALEQFDTLLCDCVTEDHYSQALMLKQQIHHAAGQRQDELRVLQEIILLHPLNVMVWLQLVDVYSSLFQLPTLNLTVSSGERPCLVTGEYDTDPSVTPTDHDVSSSTHSVPHTPGSILTNLDRASQHQQGTRKSIDARNCSGQTDCSEVEHKMAEVNNENSGRCPGLFTSEQLMSPSEDDRPGSSASVDTLEQTVSQSEGYRRHLILLTCLVRARLLLQSTQGSVKTFIHQRNSQLIRQLDERIKDIPVQKEHKEEAEQAMRQDLFKDGPQQETNAVQDTFTHAKGKTDIKQCQQEFNRRWFKWIYNLDATLNAQLVSTASD